MDKIASVDIGKSFLDSLNGVYGGSHGSSGTLGNLSGIGRIVSVFLSVSFIIAGLILLFFFVVGGIGMIGSAGKNDPQKAEEAKKTLTSAVIGFVVVFAAYWIVKLLGQILNIPNLI